MYPSCAFERLLLLLNTINKAVVSLEPGVHLYSRPQHNKLKTKKCRCPYKSISGHQQIELHWLGADSGSPHPAQLLATLNGIGLLPACPPLCFAVTAVHKKAWMDAAVADVRCWGILGVVAHACCHSPPWAEAGRFWVQRQLWVYNEILPENKRKVDNIYFCPVKRRNISQGIWRLEPFFFLIGFVPLFVIRSRVTQASVEFSM